MDSLSFISVFQDVSVNVFLFPVPSFLSGSPENARGNAFNAKP